jgi:CPA2 family monovalent cation:H+ antiporter-2
MHFPLLQDLLVLLVFAVIVVFLLQKIKLPSILGFLLTGIIIGPHGLSLVNHSEDVEVISEIGVILLLFVIGMELSIKQLISIKKSVFVGGFLQVGLTVALVSLVCIYLNFELNQAIFIGFLFSLSSTAIVLKVLQDRNEMHTPQGRNALAILIFQDIIVVPMMLVTPILAGKTDNVWESVGLLVLKTTVVLIITFVSARYLVPKFMHSIAKTGSKELFLLSTIALCFAVAFLTSEAGLSLALGAFIAGLIISESEYSHQATSIILPFRELFSSFFFVSVGMLLNLEFFFENAPMVLLIVLLVFIFKSLLAAIAIAVLKYPPRTYILTGLSLFQVGEFAFILSKVGISNGLLDEKTNQLFLAVSIFSMLITPFVIIFSEKISYGVLKIKPFKKIEEKKSHDFANFQTDELENHLVIIGYGINGSNLAKASKFANIPYIAVEFDAEIFQKEKKKGTPIIYGDASEDHILDMLNLHNAKALVIAISEPETTKVILNNIRSRNQILYIVIRTRYIKEIPELMALGADEVIPEEFETSIEIFSRILNNFLISEDEIEQFVHQIREDNYGLFQSKNRKLKGKPIKPTDYTIHTIEVGTDKSSIIGKTVESLECPVKYGVNILAISRKSKILDGIKSEEIIKNGDLLFVGGNHLAIEKFRKIVA